MLILQNVKIGGLRSFGSYFNFKELYQLLQSDDAEMFREFGLECLSNTSASAYQMPWAKTYLFGTAWLDGSSNRNTGALRLLDDPDLWMVGGFSVPGGFVPVGGKDRKPHKNGSSQAAEGSGRLLEFSKYEEFYIHLLGFFQDAMAKLPWVEQTNEQMKLSVRSALDKATDTGCRQFTPEAATELYLYFLLHSLAGVQPDNGDSFAALKADLDRLCPVSVGAQKNERVFTLSVNEDGNCKCPLEYYTGGGNGKQPITIVEFKNGGKKPVTMTVNNTVISRVIPGGKSVYGLRQDGKLLGILPRLRLEGHVVTYLWEGKLYNECEGVREAVESDITDPVCWARSTEYGTFVVNREGKLDEDAAWPDVMPTKKIVMADTCTLDYCMLFEDGTVDSRIRKRNWKDLIFVSLGTNSAAGINQSRQVVRADGNCLSGIQAADVKTYNNHYICMDAQGKIQTDTGLKWTEKAYAIAICKAGFAVAGKNAIKLFDFNNCQLTSIQTTDIFEMEADDNKLICYDGNTAEPMFFDL